MKNKEILPSIKHLPFGGAGFVSDPLLLAELDNWSSYFSLWLQDTGISKKFIETYVSWIQSTTNNHVHSLDQFDEVVQTNGTTEAFDKFYMTNHRRRFRCFRGEYMYHQATWRNHWPNWHWLDQEPITTGDAVVISLPFADTGACHPQYIEVLEQASALNVPVLVDCCYFGLCSGIDFDFSYPCITDITFGLSKTFPLSHVRVGLRFTREDNDDPASILQKTNYTNRIAAGLGIVFLQNYGPDYMYNRYSATQKKFCETLAVEVSPTVIFGIGNENWQPYNRGGTSNRLSFHKYLALGELPLDL